MDPTQERPESPFETPPDQRLQRSETPPVQRLQRSDTPPVQRHQRSETPPVRPQAAGGGGAAAATASGGDFYAIITVFFLFIVISSFVAFLSSSTLSNLTILHQVPEGHVGVYWRGGALLKTITEPGFHLKMPLITQFEPIQVTLQTDQVRDIPGGTKGGVRINFEKIEVVTRLHKDYVYETLLNYGVQYDNTWIYDKIHHEINQFCSAHSFQQVYIDMFDQVLISIEKQKVAEKEAETRKKIAIIKAEKNAHVSKILMQEKLTEKDTARMQEEIQNQAYLAREKSLADANFYRLMKEAEANKLKHIDLLMLIMVEVGKLMVAQLPPFDLETIVHEKLRLPQTIYSSFRNFPTGKQV